MTTWHMRWNARYCPKGHDKEVYGDPRHHACKECDRLRKAAKSLAWAKANPSRAHRFAVPVTNLRDIRLREGYTLGAVSRESGLSKGFLSQLERGQKRARKETQEKLVMALVRLREKRAEMRRRYEKAGLV